ncbi:nuclear receptor coactivator 6 [Ceratobasidium sp. AG-Ba]|nr:nuclear receptor coactivator 6 [Ceratobasidium sp. AG-Ba]QRW08401.1 nuclear receptor coactivator 6 [Ceratobasidium sp. AG-Ba]
MYSEPDTYHVAADDPGKAHPKLQPSMLSSEHAEVASPPLADTSDESLPLSDLSNSPSPMAGRRTSLLSDASVGVSGPLTPNKRLFEDVVVNEASGRSIEYRRIHSTPYPKPRLPMQLTPHPQARIVSLPEYSRNRDPLLESLRNPRSVSSPVRLKPAPLSPIYHETEEETDSNLEVSEHSSASVISPPRFPVIENPYQRSLETSSAYNLGPSYISGEQLYKAPRELYFTPPSFQSLKLSPFTTEIERSLPMDRPLVAQQRGVFADHGSEGEVSMMFHQMSLDAPYHPARSSIAANSNSRTSSPDSSVVFLSPVTKIPRTFLGMRRTTSKSTHRSTPSLEPIVQEPDNVAHSDDDQEDLCPNINLASEQSRFAHLEKGYFPGVHPSSGSNTTASQVAPQLAAESNKPDWVLFDDPPKPIPALHGPSSLPYARCPSGAEGVILDGSQPPDDLVWGLSEDDAPCSRPSHGPHHYEALSTTTNYRALNYTHQMDVEPADSSTLIAPPWIRPASIPRGPLSAVGKTGDATAPVGVKEKHVRFLDTHANRPTVHSTVETAQTTASQLHGSLANHKIDPSGTSRSTSEGLARLLQNQLQSTRMIENQVPRRTAGSTRQETLDQLRRFGVPFRPHVTAPVAAEPRLANARFQFVTRSASLADLLALQGHPENVQVQSFLDRNSQSTHLGPNSMGASGSVDRLPQLRSTDPAGVSRSLSNAKSIPLLRLRQRQNEESQPSPPTEVALNGNPRNSKRGNAQRQQQASLLKSNEPAWVQTPTQDEDIAVSTSPDYPRPSVSVDPSPSRRRPRKGGKHVPSNPTGQSGSLRKDHDQVPKDSGATTHQRIPRQLGKRKGN